MLRRLLKEILVIVGGTLLFLLLCASVGISRTRPPEAEAAGEQETQVQDRDFSHLGWSSVGGKFN